MLGHFRPPAAPGKVRGVPTSLSVSLPTRQLTLGGVTSAVAHMDFCFERCPISFRPASPLWCSTGTALSRSSHWTGLTLRPVQNEKPHRVHQFQRWSHPPTSSCHLFHRPPGPSLSDPADSSSHHLRTSAVSALLLPSSLWQEAPCADYDQKSVKTARKDPP